MTVEILVLEAQVPVGLRNAVLGVIAKDQEAELYIPIDGPVWLFA
jgi:hypothetical protein